MQGRNKKPSRHSLVRLKFTACRSEKYSWSTFHLMYVCFFTPVLYCRYMYEYKLHMAKVYLSVTWLYRYRNTRMKWYCVTLCAWMWYGLRGLGECIRIANGKKKFLISRSFFSFLNFSSILPAVYCKTWSVVHTIRGFRKQISGAQFCTCLKLCWFLHYPSSKWAKSPINNLIKLWR